MTNALTLVHADAHHVELNEGFCLTAQQTYHSEYIYVHFHYFLSGFRQENSFSLFVCLSYSFLTEFNN